MCSHKDIVLDKGIALDKDIYRPMVITPDRRKATAVDSSCNHTSNQDTPARTRFQLITRARIICDSHVFVDSMGVLPKFTPTLTIPKPSNFFKSEAHVITYFGCFGT